MLQDRPRHAPPTPSRPPGPTDGPDPPTAARPGAPGARPSGVARRGGPGALVWRGYTREVSVEGEERPGISLARAPHGCVFLDDTSNACTVHPARPAQCRAFPFWPANIASAGAWQSEVVALCGERAVEQGTFYPAEVLESIASRFVTGGPVRSGGATDPESPAGGAPGGGG
jgi:hypothetical protein